MIKKGIDFKSVVFSLGGGVVGGLAIYLGLFTNFGVRIGFIPLTGWLLVGVGAVITALAVLALGLSMRAYRCAACNTTLETCFAAFPPEASDQVLSAIEHNRIDQLASVAMGRLDHDHVYVDLHYCDECLDVGLLSVTQFGARKREICDARPLKGPVVRPLAELISEREAAHEARFENG